LFNIKYDAYSAVIFEEQKSTRCVLGIFLHNRITEDIIVRRHKNGKYGL